jgi:predicted transposase YbfD/YdcC
MLNLKGAIVSIDAMGTQKEIARRIVEKGADYVLALKGNQTSLHEDAALFFADPVCAEDCATSADTDAGHGRIEERSCRAAEAKWLAERHPEWEGLRSVAAVTARRIDKRTGRESLETRYYISSLEPWPHAILAATRAHWGVESFHWTLDVTFDEDLERDWEKALAEQAHLEAEHERVKRARKEAPSAAELAAIRDLSQDLPALWRAETTTQQERQTIVRLLIERVLVEVVGATEKVRVECHWHGGVHTAHELTRPVARIASLSTYAALTGRAAELRREGLECARIAEILNAEGWRPAKRRNTFNAQMVHHLLLKSGAETIKYRRRPPQIARLENEWTTRELAEEIGMPQPTLYTWIQKGRLSCRNVGSGSKRAVLVRADPETITVLKAIRATPPPWRRLPPKPANSAAAPATES